MDQTEEQKLELAAKEGAAQNHFDGVGAVMNMLVSFSDDDDDDDELGLDDDFIDGGTYKGCRWRSFRCFQPAGPCLWASKSLTSLTNTNVKNSQVFAFQGGYTIHQILSRRTEDLVYGEHGSQQNKYPRQ